MRSFLWGFGLVFLGCSVFPDSAPELDGRAGAGATGGSAGSGAGGTAGVSGASGTGGTSGGGAGGTSGGSGAGGTSGASGTGGGTSGASGSGGTPDDGGACSNGSKDGLETDIDCGGGVCPQCPNGKACLTGSDCIHKCVSKKCCNNNCQ